MSRGAVLVLAAALLRFGATQLSNMPVNALPEFSSASARSALGLSIQSSRELRVPACSVS
jgi:Cu/Ag efflux pump CusA